MAAAHNARFKVILSTDQRESIRDAAYVITQLRVGHMAARREDEYLGRRHGLIGQETTGIGGMAKALRTIPVVLDIARDIREVAPDALLVNFANPSGLVTEALFRYEPEVQAVGVCNATLTTQMEIMKGINEQMGLDLKPEDTQIMTLGLNHLTWFYGFEVNGQDIWPQVMQALITKMKRKKTRFDPQTLKTLQLLPNGYLRYYYYTEKMLEKQAQWPPSRAEEVMAIEENLLEYYRDPEQSEPPADLMKRGGAYYSTVATQLLNAHYNDQDEVHVVNVGITAQSRAGTPNGCWKYPAGSMRKGSNPSRQTPCRRYAAA